MENLKFHFGRRLFFNIFGLFILASGISLSTITGLGISPLNAVSFVLSEITGIEMGYCTILLFTFYVVLEIPIKGKSFKMIDFLQIITAVIFGCFVNWTKGFLSDVVIDSYFVAIIITLISTVLIAAGTQIYVIGKILTQATEGLILAICERWHLKFADVKNYMDILSVVVAALISFVFTGKIIGIREGTLIAALGVGRVVALLNKGFKQKLEALCWNE